FLFHPSLAPHISTFSYTTLFRSTARTAGAAFNVTVNAVDDNWNVVSTVTDLAGITSSDSNATLPANTTLSAGTRTFSLTLRTVGDRKSTRLNSSHEWISYAVFCL